jgi:hypothetical protein
MRDTPPEIGQMVRDRMMARSGEERMIMGAQMFEAAREMVKASLPRDLSEADWKRLFFKRVYGEELML